MFYYFPATLCDGYKLDHRRQYPKNTQIVYANWTPRSSRIPNQDKVVFFGLQYFLQRFLMDEFQENFFEETLTFVLRLFEERLGKYLGPNSIGTKHIRDLWELGYIPLEFRAVEEGTLVPIRYPMMVFENTIPEFFWLTNYFETLLSLCMWQPCTSATIAYRMRVLLDQWADKTGDPSFVQWQGHDFSMRGMGGLDAAASSGAGHLLSFTGTDTIPALDFIDNYYPGSENQIIGMSVAATEHSVMCAGGEECEYDTIKRLLTEIYPSGIVSVVCDTWDLFGLVTKILPTLKEEIMSREGKLVIRPDSGNPADILCGDGSDGSKGKGVVELLWDIFGGTINDKGFKILDSHIGTIYGDSINFERANEICERLAAKGFASTNVVYGIGSYTYQFNTRDTFGFAVKATWVKINDQEIDIFKKPLTDSGEKFSAKGRLALLKKGHGLYMKECASKEEEAESILTPVWKDGKFIRRSSFAEIRRNLHGNKNW